MLFFRARRWKQEELARRLCQLICGDDRVCQTADGCWHIGSANDWWLHPRGDDLFMLHYRYADRDRMWALATVMTWFLGIEDVAVDCA